jgi:deoxyadenosine/deoxycytidine kinase
MIPVFIFGPIGAGKTTVAQALATRIPGALLVPEPVEHNPFLPLYAVDQRRWALACQTRYYLDYVRICTETLAQARPAIALIDAGAPTNLHIYGRYMHEHAIVTPDEYRLYVALTSIIGQHYAHPQPSVIVSVEASVETCYARLLARGRDFELAGHTRAYVEAIHHYTAEMIAFYAQAGARVIRCDVERADTRAGEGLDEIAAALSRDL